MSPRPGEASLATQGVLFLDELPEFGRTALEALREPLETGTVSVARAGRHASFPARFQLVAAMNPCPCGHLGAPRCRCTHEQVLRYQARVSGALLDRIDLQLRLSTEAAPAGAAVPPAGEPSAAVRARVCAARDRQRRRQAVPNALLEVSGLAEHARCAPEAERLLGDALARIDASMRVRHRVLRVARTIADLEGAADVGVAHVAEAVQYRRALLAPASA